MRTIWKFQVLATENQLLMLPAGAELLSVQVQHGQPQLWALVDPGAPVETRRIGTFGTGHGVPSDASRHLGTFQLHEGALVFHTFELKS